MRLTPLLCAAAMLVGTSVSVHAQWKWKDAAGQVHASDMPPPREVPDKDILQRPSVPSRRVVAASTPVALPASAAASMPAGDPELEARKARAEADAKARAKAEEEKIARARAENCQRARQQMRLLESGERIVRIDAQGERVFLDDQARAREIAQTQQAIASDCRR